MHSSVESLCSDEIQKTFERWCRIATHVQDASSISITILREPTFKPWEKLAEHLRMKARNTDGSRLLLRYFIVRHLDIRAQTVCSQFTTSSQNWNARISWQILVPNIRANNSGKDAKT